MITPEYEALSNMLQKLDNQINVLLFTLATW